MTGATGTVGREVAWALVGLPGVELRLGMRAPSAAGPWPADVEKVRFDLDEESTLGPALDGVASIFFVSPLVEHQVTQGIRLLEAARAAGVTQCVRLSSRATGWDDVCVLRRWHREIESAIVASGLGYTMLRPCSFMQNLLGAPLARARETGVLSIPLGEGRIPFVDAHDLGEAAARCLLDPAEHAGRTYVLTGGRALSGHELADAMAHALARPVRYVPTAKEAARRGGREAGLPDWLVESGLRVYARAEGGDEAEVDPTLARLLARPPTGIEAFLERELAAAR